MAKSKPKKNQVTLRSMIQENMIDTSHLVGIVDDQPVTITSILTNTAVYYHTGESGKKMVESLEKILVDKNQVNYLPVRISTRPPQKPKKQTTKTT
jgi:hypothetical protein